MYQHKTEDQIWNELKNGKGNQAHASPASSPASNSNQPHQSNQSQSSKAVSNSQQSITSAHLKQQLDEIREEVNKICQLDNAQEKKERQQTVSSILNVLTTCLSEQKQKELA